MSKLFVSPCSYQSCIFFEKMEIDSEKSLSATTMPHVFGNSAKVCLACVHFMKFDMFEDYKKVFQ